MKFAYSVTYAFSDNSTQVIKHTCVWLDKEVTSVDDEKTLTGQLMAAESKGTRSWVEVTLMWYTRLPGSDKTS